MWLSIAHGLTGGSRARVSNKGVYDQGMKNSLLAGERILQNP